MSKVPVRPDEENFTLNLWNVGLPAENSVIQLYKVVALKCRLRKLRFAIMTFFKLIRNGGEDALARKVTFSALCENAYSGLSRFLEA